MSNKYGYNSTYDDLIEEEDRECLNDLLRAQTAYYKTITDINIRFLKVLEDMTDDEIEEAFINGLRIPVRHIW